MFKPKLISLLILLISAPGLLFPASAFAGIFPPDPRISPGGVPALDAEPFVHEAESSMEDSDILSRLPLSFIPNEGQVDEKARFYAQAGSQSIWFAADGVTLSLPEITLRLAFLDAQPDPLIEGAEQKAGVVSYFKGNDPARWHSGLPTYSQVVFRDLWPGVDLAYEGRSGALKSTFTVAPGADPARIRLAYPQADGLRVDAQGNLVIQFGDSEVLESPPVAWQQTGENRSYIVADYRLEADGNSYNFVLPQGYDLAYPLVIDPELQYSTYVGGSDDDSGRGIFVDEEGRAYVTGSTTHPGETPSDFPTTPGAYDTTFNGVQDIFVLRLNANGTDLDFATFIGGGGTDTGKDVAVDGSGNSYITGYTASSSFPTTFMAHDSTYNGGDYDAFVVKLNASGSGLIYSTFLGGGDWDWADGIAVDASGYAYVTGNTDSSNFPTTPGSYDTSHNSSKDAFVVKLNTNGRNLIYATYLGGGLDDGGNDLILPDDTGKVCLTGYTKSTDFPTPGGYDTSLGGTQDAFVARLNADGTDLEFATLFGGGGSETGYGVAVDRAGHLSIAGLTYSSDLPGVAGAYDASYGGDGDAFVAKFSLDGSTLDYATYLGGSDFDRGQDIIVDGGGSAYVTGWTGSGTFPTSPGAYDDTQTGTTDAYITALNADGTDLVYSTFLGGGGKEWGHAFASDGVGSVYLAGTTTSSNFPVTTKAYDESKNAGDDIFVTHFAFPVSVLLSEAEDALAASAEYRENFHLPGKEAQAGYTISDTLANYATSGILQAERAEAYYEATLRFSEPGTPTETQALKGLLNANWELATGAMMHGNEWLVQAIDTDLSDPSNALDEEIDQLQEAVGWYETATSGYSELWASDISADAIALQPTRFHPVSGKLTPYLDLKRLALAAAKESRAYLELAERQFRKYTAQSKVDADVTLRKGTAEALASAALLEGLWAGAEEDINFKALLQHLSGMQRLHRYLLEGKNPFGFGPEYVPFVYRPSKQGNNYEQALEQAQDKLDAASTALDEAEAHQRELDDDYDTLQQQLADVSSTFNDQLIDLCGADPEDSTAPDLASCHENESGEIYLQLLRITEANLRVELVEQQMANQLDLIRIEQERAARVRGLYHATAIMYSITGVQLSSLALEEAKLGNRSSWTDRVTNGVNNARTGAEIGGAFGPFGAAAGAIIGGLTAVSKVAEEEMKADRLGAVAAKREHLQAQQDGYVAYAEAGIEDANSEALIKQYYLEFTEYDIELSIAMNNLAQELARLNGLKTKVEYLAAEKEKALAFNRALYEDPAERVMRDYYTELASDSFGVALRYAWETGRALAYEINQDPSFTDGPMSDLDDLYRVREDSTLRESLNQMDTAFEDFYKRPDVPNEPAATQDVVYLSQALGFEDAYDADQGKVVTRKDKFRAFVRDPANRDEQGNLQFTFQTSIATGNPFFSTAVFNDKVTSVQMRLRGGNLGNDRAIISLEQSGTSFMRTLDAFQGGGPDEVREYNVSPLKARITAATNNSTLPDSVALNQELATRSVAFTNWTLTLDQVNEPENQDVDILKIHDIEMTIDHEAYTLQTMLHTTGEASTQASGLSSASILANSGPQTPEVVPQPLTGTYVGMVVITDPSGITPLDLVIVLTDTAGVLSGYIDAVQLPTYPLAGDGTGPAVGGAWAASSFTLQSAAFEDPYSGATRQVELQNGAIEDDGEILTGGYRETISGLTPTPLVLSGEFRLSRPSHLPPAGQPASLHLSAMPARIQPESDTSIVVTLNDFYGDPVDGAQVSLSAGAGTVGAQATTDSAGEAIVTYTASDAIGWDTVSAAVDALTDTVDIEITGYPCIFLPMVVKSP